MPGSPPPRSPQDHLDVVRQRYAAIATGDVAGCCSQNPAVAADRPEPEPGCCAPAPITLHETARALGYADDQIALLPADAQLSLGCGNPLAAAMLRPGMTVLDLGSGAGFDCFLAAAQVGPTGHVIGVDMTPEMIARARSAAAAAGHGNVEFRLGELAHLPVADGTVDVILSNCVINLTPDKTQVFRESLRVLKPGGRLAISDVVRIAAMPAAMAEDAGSLCSCIAGAATVDELRGALASAGFEDIRIVVNDRSGEFIKDWEPGSGAENFVRAALVEARRPTVSA